MKHQTTEAKFAFSSTKVRAQNLTQNVLSSTIQRVSFVRRSLDASLAIKVYHPIAIKAPYSSLAVCSLRKKYLQAKKAKEAKHKQTKPKLRAKANSPKF